MEAPRIFRERTKRRQLGVTAVEFALVAVFIFLPIVLAITSFGRWMYTLNAATEATRFGARVAAVCDQDDPQIKDRVRTFLPQATDANIVIRYWSSTADPCTRANCETVTVSLSNFSIAGLLWFPVPGNVPLLSSMPIPAFAHTLPRESMLSAIDGSPNSLCQ